jgi:DNA-binding NarL/FixJ family response regulator
MARSRNLRKTRVLIVDDSARLREGLTSLCSLQSKLEVVGTAGDGVEALEAIRNLKPDVVSLDIRMPRMSGIEVLRAIRRDRLSCTPIVLSGMTDEIVRKKCLALGARYVFDKSSDLEKFLQVLGRSHKIRKRFPADKSYARKQRCRSAPVPGRSRVRAGPAGKLRRKPKEEGRQMS